ncbi:MAG: EI24 domain-containing protein [Verrucomicrobiales bacterium]
MSKNDSTRKSKRRSSLAAMLRGLKCYARVPATLTRHGLWRYQLLPAFTSLVLSTLMVIAMYWSSRGLAGWVDQRIVLPVAWLDAAVTWAAGILAFVAMVLGFVFLHKHIVIVALAPYLSKIAETITRAEAGPQPNTEMVGLATFKRSAIINTRSILLEIITTLSLIALGFVIPVLSPFTSLLVILVEARFAGNGLMDFPLEYRGLSVIESIEWSRTRKATATGVGIGYLLLMLIPIVGWMFAPTFGTVAGTLQSLDELKEAD